MLSPESEFNNWKLSGFAGAQAFLFPCIESTHALMKEKALAKEILPGTLFVADAQNSGRGRHERTWASPAGKNLYFNILIPLDGIPPNRYAQITQVAALTFAEVFNGIDPVKNQDIQNPSGITVKWPNDILYGKSKFCGILAEVIFIPGASSPALNMGVGINVNSDSKDYAFLNRSVTTLKSIVGCTINREILLKSLIANLERALGQFRAFGISPWVSAWKKMDKFIGARGTIIVSKNCTDHNRDGGNGVQKKSGCILDMQNDGSILFQTDDGEIQSVYSADLDI